MQINKWRHLTVCVKCTLYYLCLFSLWNKWVISTAVMRDNRSYKHRYMHEGINAYMHTHKTNGYMYVICLGYSKKAPRLCLWKRGNTVVLSKNKTTTCDAKIYVQIHMHKENEKQRKWDFSLCQNYKPTVAKNWFSKMAQYTRGKWSIHGSNTVRTLSCKEWNSPIGYCSWEDEFDINGSDQCNMFNLIF